MCRKIFSVLLISALGMLCPGRSSCQLNKPELQVKVRWMDNDRVSLQSLRVELITATSNELVDQAFCDDTGDARIRNVNNGTYRLRITGSNVEETLSSAFRIDTGIFYSQFVLVKYKPPADGKAAGSTDPSISTAMLNIPDKARHEFEKGSAALEKNQLDQAKKRFSTAAELYPKYAAAWNNLGIIAVRAGDTAGGTEYFHKAIEADSQFGPVYINRAKSFFGKSDYVHAEEDLSKAVSLLPSSVEALCS
jgi:tetratricopeptide (TPR) repeat protein